MSNPPFERWLISLKRQMDRVFEECGRRIPRSLRAPFVDARAYYDAGYPPRRAAECLLGVAAEARGFAIIAGPPNLSLQEKAAAPPAEGGSP